MEDYILEECPTCRGEAVLVHEGGWSVQVECTCCGSHSVYLEYRDEKSKKEAEAQVVRLWNMGKVIHSGNGE